MIKLPEPVAGVFSKFGDPEAFGERELEVLTDLRKIPYRTKLYTEAQLKQAVRDAYEDAAKVCDRLRREQIRYFNGMGSAGCPEYGPSDCADAIRALIKEIPE